MSTVASFLFGPVLNLLPTLACNNNSITKLKSVKLYII